MISDSLEQKIIEAMKTGDKVRLSTLKLLSAALHSAVIDKKREALTEQEELAIVKSEAKKRKDAIEAYNKAGAQDRAKAEVEELKILQEYLPEELSDGEISKIVDAAISTLHAKSMADMGKVMGEAMNNTGGRADGNRVSELVKEKLSGK